MSAKLAVGDGQCERPAWKERSLPFGLGVSGLPLKSRDNGVAQGDSVPSNDPESLPDVRRTDPRSAEIERPDGVTRRFQVRLNKVEPSEAVLARNLFSKDFARAALADEVVPSRP